MDKSELIEAIYEIVANTDFREEGEITLIDLINSEFELDKNAGNITIIDEGIKYTITVTREEL